MSRTGSGSDETVAILAGAGTLPVEVARSLVAQGRPVHIVGLTGVADDAISEFSHSWTGLGQVGRMLRLMRSNRCTHLVIVGGLKRPNLWSLVPDFGFFQHFGRISTIMRGGDDAVLRRVVGFFEEQGLEVIGAADAAPELLANAALDAGIGCSAMDETTAQIAEQGIRALHELSHFDIGQAAAVGNGGLLGIEDGGGTARLLKSLQLAAGTQAALVKLPKQGQEMRIDMPTIGPQTIVDAAAAGVSNIVVDGRATLIAERDKTCAAASEAGVRLHAITSDNEAVAEPPKAAATDLERAVAFVNAAWPMTDGKSLGVFVRRGHPMVCLIDGIANAAWQDRLSKISPLRTLGVLPKRSGALVLIGDADAVEELTNESRFADVLEAAGTLQAAAVTVLVTNDADARHVAALRSSAGTARRGGLTVSIEHCETSPAGLA
ncbi:MAG: UDP-2,3-diacylglucosamine diphosphatase LpxI [Pseudomonadota bacterium]